MKNYYDFSQFLNCSCEIYFEANLRFQKGCVISLKKLSRKEKVNILLWHHPKLTYEIIVQNGHEQVFYHIMRVFTSDLHRGQINYGQVLFSSVLSHLFFTSYKKVCWFTVSSSKGRVCQKTKIQSWFEENKTWKKLKAAYNKKCIKNQEASSKSVSMSY